MQKKKKKKNKKKHLYSLDPAWEFIFVNDHFWSFIAYLVNFYLLPHKQI